jgi:CelD/BcsL family acetyltransferase involved in cellulose biosynthesis
MAEVSIKRASALSNDERHAWRALQGADPLLASPYFSLEFFDAMAAVREDVRVIIRREAGGPVAFLPVQLGLLGHARPLGGPLSDHHGLIGEAGDPGVLVDMLHRAGVGVLDFHGALARQPAFGSQTQERTGSWVIDLSKGYDAFIETRSGVEPKAFRNLRARRRKIDAAGAVLRVRDDRPEVLQTALAWKSAQYTASGHFDVFSVAWTRNLVDQLNRLRGGDCEGLVSSLEIGGELAAVHFGMRSRSVLHYWFPVYDPKFAKLGPGLALLMDLCKALSEDSITEIHLGPGDYDFKAQLASWQIPLAIGFAGSGLAASVRRLSEAVEMGAERMPLGPFARWPGKAFRRIDLMAGFRAA